MTIEHNNPDMVCDCCYRRVDTCFDGDSHCAWERGWGVNNVIYPMNADNRTTEQYESGRAAERFEHLCPKCLDERGWTVTGDLDDPEWPFINASSMHAPEPDYV